MTAKNLAIVFGPNLAWTRQNTNLNANNVIKVNDFIEYLIENHEKIYDFDMNRWKTVQKSSKHAIPQQTSFKKDSKRKKIRDFAVKYLVPSNPNYYFM